MKNVTTHGRDAAVCASVLAAAAGVSHRFTRCLTCAAALLSCLSLISEGGSSSQQTSCTGATASGASNGLAVMRYVCLISSVVRFECGYFFGGVCATLCTRLTDRNQKKQSREKEAAEERERVSASKEADRLLRFHLSTLSPLLRLRCLCRCLSASQLVSLPSLVDSTATEESSRYT
jgi:hypothetical protein